MTTISNIDLHCHTTASDGSLSPTAIVARAYGRGLNVLAITDHDLVAGVEEGIRAAEKCNALLLAHAPDAPREHYLHGMMSRSMLLAFLWTSITHVCSN